MTIAKNEIIKADDIYSGIYYPIEIVQDLGTKSGSFSINVDGGNVITLTTEGTSTITLSTSVNRGFARCITIVLTCSSSGTNVTFNNIKWSDGDVPSFTRGTHLLTFLKIGDNGFWYGTYSSNFS